LFTVSRALPATGNPEARFARSAYSFLSRVLLGQFPVGALLAAVRALEAHARDPTFGVDLYRMDHGLVYGLYAQRDRLLDMDRDAL